MLNRYKFFSLITLFMVLLFILLYNALNHIEGLYTDTKEVTDVDIPSVLIVSEVEVKFQTLLKQVILAYQPAQRNPLQAKANADSIKSLLDSINNDLTEIRNLKHAHTHEINILDEMTGLLFNVSYEFSSKVLPDISSQTYSPEVLSWVIQNQVKVFSRLDGSIKGVRKHQALEVAEYAAKFKGHYDYISALLLKLVMLAMFAWVIVIYMVMKLINLKEATSTVTLEGQVFKCISHNNTAITLERQ